MNAAAVWFMNNSGPDAIVLGTPRRRACGLPVQELPGGPRKTAAAPVPVEQYDRSWKLVGSFSSLQEAYAWTGIDPEQIERACAAGFGLAGNFRWRYAS